METMDVLLLRFEVLVSTRLPPPTMIPVLLCYFSFGKRLYRRQSSTLRLAKRALCAFSHPAKVRGSVAVRIKSSHFDASTKRENDVGEPAEYFLAH